MLLDFNPDNSQNFMFERNLQNHLCASWYLLLPSTILLNGGNMITYYLHLFCFHLMCSQERKELDEGKPKIVHVQGAEA